MKFLILAFLFSFKLFAGTCTGISRTNYTFGQVLSSSSLNTNLNTVYGAVNAFDGGCITDNTLELAAINTTEWEVPLRAIQAGCTVAYSSASTVSIGKCYASVNGLWVAKSTATTVTMGCTNCSSEVSSTTYYIYISTGSSGSTLTPLILTSAPGVDGYDSSGNKVVARIYNNASSDIDQYSIDQWVVNRFIPTNTSDISYTPVSTWLTNVTLTGKFQRVGGYMKIQYKAATTGAPTSANLVFDLPTGYLIDTARMIETDAAGNTIQLGLATCTDGGSSTYSAVTRYVDSNSFGLSTNDTSGGAGFAYAPVSSTTPFTFGNTDKAFGEALVPIVGWVD